MAHTACLRRTSDAVWPPKKRAYGGEVEILWLRVKGPAQMALRLVLPVMLLTTLLIPYYLLRPAMRPLAGMNGY